ncbi:peptidylprolyl isomerase [Granulicella mallensis]|uniref:SurA domain protein n=1 Tax=Granulicella mallensis TaxID=940614 RepID=A0A7W7ZS94_9BACT|nr:peptidylprolyl isomerase [Granulicella mallensis]MBB5065227.1 hypothetical protein [Granulicella mallensis]
MMTRTRQPDSLRLRLLVIAAVCVLPGTMRAQSTAQKNSVPVTAPEPQAVAPQMPLAQGMALDRVVAIVNGDLILDSDVNEEIRLQVFQPYRNPNADTSRDRAIERLINRSLILQQLKLQPEDPITDDQVRKDLDSLRKNIPACKPYNCETPDGWNKFLAANGFTEAVLINRWRSRMEVLRFIEERFRLGIKIKPEEIKDYYDKMLLPEYARQKATPPSLESISSRIQEVLLQQEVSNLLGDWLRSLRAQGSVVVLHPEEGAP